MFMKKLLALVFALVMLCGAACAETLYVATNPEYEPFEYVENGKPAGFDVDLAYAIGEKLGMDVVIESMAFDSIISTVATNPNYIGIAAITITDERKLQVNFTLPYFNAQMVVISKKDNGVVDAETLKGKTIGVQLGTTGDFAASDYTEKVERFPKVLDAIMELGNGKLDAVITDKPVAESLLASIGNESLYLLDTVQFGEDYLGIEVSKDNPELLDKIHIAMFTIFTDGTYDALIEKYFGA